MKKYILSIICILHCCLGVIFLFFNPYQNPNSESIGIVTGLIIIPSLLLLFSFLTHHYRLAFLFFIIQTPVSLYLGVVSFFSIWNLFIPLSLIILYLLIQNKKNSSGLFS